MVSNDGLVIGRSVTKLNYCTFTYKKTCYVHRVVYELFVGAIPKGYQINHINGIKTDNRVENLEAVTISENRRHAYRVGLQIPHERSGDVNPNYRNGAFLKLGKYAYSKAWQRAKWRGLDWSKLTLDEKFALLKTPRRNNQGEFQKQKK